MLLSRTASAARLALLALPALGGCPWSGESPCDIDGLTEVGLVYADENGSVHDVGEGDAIPLISAPQGGHIVLVAPRVRAAEQCELQVNAALRDPASLRVVGLEERPVVVHPRGDGWAAPEAPAGLSDLANVAVCPSVVTTVDGAPLRLEVQLLDDAGTRIAGGTATVRPTCSSDYCRSDCGP
ncbi:MAG TPA: hypothetical protein VNO30_09285 [Kofleriaceae bacterium]|nr:hypothetical protein [Kofleriaceae bacterium]